VKLIAQSVEECDAHNA
jgi:hypothetical protein